VGYTVTASPSGASALDGFAPGQVDVVMVDLGMAGMNGWEFVERLRTVDAVVPVLLVTGWGLRDEDHARLARLGIQRCLFKPVQPRDLDAAIQETLA
jgi:DNA-binding response OmpR family regulator